MIVGITCNIFIVGINQIQDIEIDRINKPYLPIPAGIISLSQAKRIVFGSLAISLGLGFYISPYLFTIVALSTSIGWAYSMPPFYLKKHHISAALSISIVRGILLNAGGFLLFNYILNNKLEMPHDIKILTLFVIAFSVVISWFKDISAIEGDAKFNIKTLAITFSPKHVLIAGNNIHESIKKYYKRFWWFFFAEYLIYLFAYLYNY